VPADEDMRAWIEWTLCERLADLELVMESEAEVLAVRLLCGRPIADAQALIAEAISVSAMRFLTGEEEEERILGLADMQAAARTLGIDAAECPS
jgi:hypothetical protein